MSLASQERSGIADPIIFFDANQEFPSRSPGHLPQWLAVTRTFEEVAPQAKLPCQWRACFFAKVEQCRLIYSDAAIYSLLAPV